MSNAHTDIMLTMECARRHRMNANFTTTQKDYATNATKDIILITEFATSLIHYVPKPTQTATVQNAIIVTYQLMENAMPNPI